MHALVAVGWQLGNEHADVGDQLGIRQRRRPRRRGGGLLRMVDRCRVTGVSDRALGYRSPRDYIAQTREAPSGLLGATTEHRPLVASAPRKNILGDVNPNRWW